MLRSCFISGPNGDRMMSHIFITDYLVHFMSFDRPRSGLCFFTFVIWFGGFFLAWPMVGFEV